MLCLVGHPRRRVEVGKALGEAPSEFVNCVAQCLILLGVNTPAKVCRDVEKKVLC